LFRRVVAASVVLGAAACGPIRADSNLAPGERAIVYFTNESLDQADVYAITSGTLRTRIGTVMAGRTEALAIPSTVIGAGNVTVVARLLARSGYIGTGPFTLQAGDEYSVRLASGASTLVLLPARRNDLAHRMR
jgi:hypothetical protein